jgi:hypothetical protein
MAQIHQIFFIENFKLSDFYDKFQQVAKNIKEFSFFFTFILVNHLMDDHHFNLHHKIKEKKKKKREKKQGVCHTVALPFTLKSILRQKNNYGNSNISPCKNIIFKKKIL